MELIDKSALAVELEKRIEEGENVAKELPSSAIMGLTQAYKNVLSFLDTLEVKEVDVEEEMNKWRQKHFEGIGYILDGSGEWLERTSQLDIAKHFYELGLKAKGE